MLKIRLRKWGFDIENAYTPHSNRVKSRKQDFANNWIHPPLDTVNIVTTKRKLLNNIYRD